MYLFGLVLCGVAGWLAADSNGFKGIIAVIAGQIGLFLMLSA